MNWKLIKRNGINEGELPRSVALVDLDFFIRYCIRFSQETVNVIITEITEFFVEYLKDNMTLYKSEGDEYLIEFYDFNQKMAEEYLITLKKLFRKQHFLEKADYSCRFARISFSTGIAECVEEGGGIVFARQKALVALNQAKSLRRNCIICFIEEFKTISNAVYYSDKIVLSILFGKSGNRGYCKVKTNKYGALLDEPQSIDVDSENNIYIADQNNHSIVKYDGTHVYSIIGNGVFSNSIAIKNVDENCLNKPTGITVKDKCLYITDTGNDVVWKVDLALLKMSIIAGIGTPGYEGDGHQAVDAKLNKPGGIVVDNENNVYINDIANNVIRKVDANGIITTYAGSGEYGYSGDGKDACKATFGEIYGMGIDRKKQEIYLADYHNHCIRMIQIKSHIITTIAGTGEEGYSGDGEDAGKSRLSKPVAVTIDKNKNIIIAESGNSCIRIIQRKTNKIYTLVGDGTWGIGEEEQGCHFQFANPNGVCVDKNGILYVIDGSNNRICLIQYERKN